MSTTQNIHWNRIAIEGAAIVASILLAFAIDAWWEERQERALELEYLIALEKDIRATVQNLEDQLDQVSNLYAAIDSVLAVIADTKTSELPASFSSMVSDVYQIPRPTAITGTYEDMVNSGKLHLLRDADLRVTVAEYMRSLDVLEFHANLNVQTFWNVHAPFHNQFLLFNEFDWGTDLDNSSGGAVKFEIPPEITPPFQLGTDAIKSQEFWNLMLGWRILYLDYANSVITARDLSTKILELLDRNIDSISD
jgi:hypothetical protein